MGWDSIFDVVLQNGSDLTSGVLALILLWFSWYTYRRIVAGDLVPRSVHEDIREQRDLWQQAAEENAEQRKQLIASLEVTQCLLRAVQESLTHREGS